ncbi:MAG: RNA methyltransferase [Desulfuromonas sp.]|nr:MAG: RNA methyltransferase [Desulfuromonas sp.]
MAYDEHLADRIRQVFDECHVATEEKRMMGGLCFMVNGKMCAGIVNERLMARVDPTVYEQVLQREGAREMDFTGRPMRGFVFVEAEGIDEDEDLLFWLDLCLEYNPRARSSRKRSGKK